MTTKSIVRRLEVEIFVVFITDHWLKYYQKTGTLKALFYTTTFIPGVRI